MNVPSVVCWLERFISLHLIPKTGNHLWREQSIWKPHVFRAGWYHLSRRSAWSQAMESLLPHWVPHVFSLHCHHVSREAAHQPRCWSRGRPTAHVFPCVRKSTVTSDSRRCCGLPEITVWVWGSALQQRAWEGGQWPNWQPVKDSSLLPQPPHLAMSSVPSPLDLDQEREIY